jgi:hypothetical protein
MAIDVATFLSLYPEFDRAPTPLVQAKLNEAILMCPSTVWGGAVPTVVGPATPNVATTPDFDRAPAGFGGDLTQMGVFLYCAKFLALSPFARKMALTNKDGSTIYDARLNELKRTVTSGARVL